MEKQKVKKEKLIEVGKIDHFFTNINVAVVKVSKPLKPGDEILIKGNTTDFKQKIESMQIEGKPVKEAKKGDMIGLKVKDKVRESDIVYKI